MPLLVNQRGGVDGIRDTLQQMQAMVNRSYLHELIRQQAAQAIRNCQPSDKMCQASSLMIWVQRKMRFVKDPVGVEALHDPIMIARSIAQGGVPYGDCDDFSLYLATLMKSVGMPASFRAVGFNGGHLSHVYVIGPNNLKLDATRDMWNPTLGELLPETSGLQMRV